jgi:outer membrane receptor protein involved in Fe transport
MTRRIQASCGLALIAVLLALGSPSVTAAQEAGPTGSVVGRVTDDRGTALGGAEVMVAGRPATATRSNADGTYLLANVPAGQTVLRARLIGYGSVTASVTVTAGGRATQDFSLQTDPLKLSEVVITGTETPRTKLEATNATTVLSPSDIARAAPRSTTEILRYVPGFTRVESSGGEVNENYTMRGILGVEYVMFLEDGLPVYPTMHTFFMNADNLFRIDDNIERVEVVRGGGSALFGSNTPGAIMNLINRTGGPEVTGTLRVTGGTGGLARNDFNINGPLGDEWRFNTGGYYRYDHGVRNPGFPGIRGGQLKASLTRLLSDGFVRVSFKYIDDRNQFILPLPFVNPSDPAYVSGFSDYGSMSTNEGNHVRVPTPTGDLVLPLENGLRTNGYWLTADAGFNFGSGWSFQNTAQVMSNAQEWNAIVPFNVLPDTAWITSLGLTADSTKLYFTNVVDDSTGAPVQFNTPNRLVAPSGEWHVEKPISAFQNQVQVRRQAENFTFALGVYFANYTQQNRWFFTEVLMDVRDNPHFLDLLAFQAANTLFVTQNGFRNYVSLYRNATGQTTVFSPTLGGSIKLSDRLRADLGVRYEWNVYVQSAENTSTFDLDGTAATTYDNVNFGNGSFRHFNRTLGDWAASVGLNYALNPQTAVYAQAARGYKMPALDEFIDAAAQQQVDVFGARRVFSGELGVRRASRSLGLSVNGFYTALTNQVGQGLLTISGRTAWVSLPTPDVASFGLEVEASANPSPGLSILGGATLIKSQFSSCPDSTATAPARRCPAFTKVGTFINGVPPVIGNLSATYTLGSGVNLLADWHFVASRYNDTPDSASRRNELPAYSYANLGASYVIRNPGITVSANLLNAYQSKGLEEGNPRLQSGTTSNLFLARPILPRRFTVSLKYDF